MFLLVLFTIFSFFYTERVVNLSRNKDIIMQQIKIQKSKKEVQPINGVVESNTILVGVSGKTIDIESSYEKMKRIKNYNEILLEYVDVKPLITKDENYERLIIGSATDKKNISLVFQTNDINKIKQIVYICNKNNVPVTFFADSKLLENNLLVMKDLFNKNISLGLYSYNSVFDNVSTKYVKRFLSKNFKYSNYCLYKDNWFLKACSFCKINTIKPVLIEKYVYSYLKNNKKPGKLYLIKANENNIKELNTLIIYLKEKGYKIVSIDDLLKE